MKTRMRRIGGCVVADALAGRLASGGLVAGAHPHQLRVTRGSLKVRPEQREPSHVPLMHSSDD